MNINTTVWVDSMSTSVAQIFDFDLMNAESLTPSQVIFEAAKAYRVAQVAHNGTLPEGPYVNFASPLVADQGPAIDESGDFSLAQRISLQSRIIYSPAASVAPQTSTTII